MLKSTPIILFDLDGTVIDSTEAIIESFQYALRENGFQEIAQEKITSVVGHPLQVMFEKNGTPSEKVHDVIASYKENYRKIANEKTFLLPKAKEAVELASKYAKIGVVTTKTAKYSIEILEHLKIMHYFETLIGFEDVQNLKPHPEPILTALKRMKHSGEEAWMIGDTQMDILSADSAKINSFAVTSGYESKESLEKFTTNIESDVYNAVKKILDNINQKDI